jgi:hypothetical protein
MAEDRAERPEQLSLGDRAIGYAELVKKYGPC